MEGNEFRDKKEHLTSCVRVRFWHCAAALYVAPGSGGWLGNLPISRCDGM